MAGPRPAMTVGSMSRYQRAVVQAPLCRVRCKVSCAERLHRLCEARAGAFATTCHRSAQTARKAADPPRPGTRPGSWGLGPVSPGARHKGGSGSLPVEVTLAEGRAGRAAATAAGIGTAGQPWDGPVHDPVGTIGSGWAGAARCHGWRIWCRRQRRHDGGHRHDAPACVHEQCGKAAVVGDDGDGDLMPQRMSRHDPEVPTDIGDNGADRTAANLGGDLAGRGQPGDARVGRAGAAPRRPGSARLAKGWRAYGNRRGRYAREAADQPGLERGGAMQAAGDARQDLRDVDGAEVAGEFGEVGGGGALLQRAGQLPAVIDECAHEAEEAPGMVGWDGGGGQGGHERNKNTEPWRCQGIFSRAVRWAAPDCRARSWSPKVNASGPEPPSATSSAWRSARRSIIRRRWKSQTSVR